MTCPTCINIGALPSTSSLISYATDANIGKVLRFTTTGSTSGSIWGTDIYTRDSPVGPSSVHAGRLAAGAQGSLCATISATSTYTGSTRNGVTSSSYGTYPYPYQYVDCP